MADHSITSRQVVDPPAPHTIGAADDAPAERQRTVRRLQRLARLMDSEFRLPVVGVRIGWDGIIGLVPGVGDFVGLAVSSYIVVEAQKLDVSKITTARMLGNVGLDWLIGEIPVLGDLFDIAFKADLRNLRLLGIDPQEQPPADR